MRLAVLAILPLTLAACGGQPDTPGARAAHERHENFETIGGAFKKINDTPKDESPNVDTLRASAQTIAALAPKVETWFPKGSGPADGIKTDALQTVWTKPAEFQRIAQGFAAAAERLDAHAKASDVAGVKASAMQLGAACKACHEQFREKD